MMRYRSSLALLSEWLVAVNAGRSSAASCRLVSSQADLGSTLRKFQRDEEKFFRQRDADLVRNRAQASRVAASLLEEAESKIAAGGTVDTKQLAESILSRALDLATKAVPSHVGMPRNAFPPQRAAVQALIDQARRKAAAELLDRALLSATNDSSPSPSSTLARQVVETAHGLALAGIPEPARNFAASDILARAQDVAKMRLSKAPERIDTSHVPFLRQSDPFSSSSTSSSSAPSNRQTMTNDGLSHEAMLHGPGVKTWDDFAPTEAAEERQRMDETSRQQSMAASLGAAVVLVLMLFAAQPKIASWLGFSSPERDAVTLREQDVQHLLLRNGQHWTQPASSSSSLSSSSSSDVDTLAILMADYAAISRQRSSAARTAALADIEREIKSINPNAKLPKSSWWPFR